MTPRSPHSLSESAQDFQPLATAPHQPWYRDLHLAELVSTGAADLIRAARDMLDDGYPLSSALAKGAAHYCARHQLPVAAATLVEAEALRLVLNVFADQGAEPLIRELPTLLASFDRLPIAEQRRLMATPLQQSQQSSDASRTRTAIRPITLQERFAAPSSHSNSPRPGR
ncbi:hypothetical protein AB0J38_24975 [Streptomyces sp. NPDC050095]|uniref:hypothetical protein n=1 Tax=unclassified Streptomyces TaxID=2593676 RepID=UPI003415B8EA